MDHQGKQKKLQNLTQFTKSLFLKHKTHLVLSFSLLSLLLTNFSRFSFLYSFNTKFSTFPIKLFTHTLNKNYTFLICNGILVFVAKISSSRKSSKSNNSSTLEPYRYYNHHENEAMILESSVILLEKEEVEDNHVQENVDDEKGSQESHATTQEDQYMQKEESYFVQENEEQEREHEHEQEREVGEEDVEQREVIELDEWSPVQEDYEEEDDEDDDENGVLSTEELNKRFDEFIKRMKEGLRIEARQQYLVMVN